MCSHRRCFIVTGTAHIVMLPENAFSINSLNVSVSFGSVWTAPSSELCSAAVMYAVKNEFYVKLELNIVGLSVYFFYWLG